MSHKTESPLVIIGRLNTLITESKILIALDQELDRVIRELSGEWTSQELITYARTTFPVRERLPSYKRFVTAAYNFAKADGEDANIMFKGLESYIDQKKVKP